MKIQFLIFSLFFNLITSAQTLTYDYYKILRLDTIPACQNRFKDIKACNQCYLKYFELMSDRWFNNYSEKNKMCGNNIWFYGDCENQRNFTYDSVAVTIHFNKPKYYSKKYMFTPAEAEAFFMKKGKK